MGRCRRVRLPLATSASAALGDSGEKFLSQAYNDPYAMERSVCASRSQFRKLTGDGGADLAGLEITLAQKYALPFASFIAVIIALPLAVRFGKKGRTLGIALSVVVLFIYYILSAVGAAFGKNGALTAVDRRLAPQRRSWRRSAATRSHKKTAEVRALLAVAIAWR